MTVSLWYTNFIHEHVPVTLTACVLHRARNSTIWTLEIEVKDSDQLEKKLELVYQKSIAAAVLYTKEKQGELWDLH